MNDRPREAVAMLADEDTAELPALKLEPARAGEATALVDGLAATDSWRVAPDQQLALEQQAEIGTLRLNLASVTESHDRLENRLRALTMNLRDLEERLGAKSTELATQERTLTAREVQIAELQAREQGREQAHQEALRAADARCQQLEAQLQERDRQARDAQDRVVALQVELEAATPRQAELQARRLEAEQRGAELQHALQALQLAHADLQAQHERTLAGSDTLRRDLGEQLDALRGLQQQVEGLVVERDRARNELRVAEERLRAAISELRSRDQRLERLTASEAALNSRSTELGRQLAERDALIHRLEHEAESSAAVLGKIQSNLGRVDKGESALPRDLLARLLVRNDGNTEIVQVLGRRTLIGRGVDCQLQIDAEFVSRRHALVMVGPDETVIEDLNSTNGVYVNGLRVSRRRLAEGDQVMVGKTLFRYVVKPVGDRSG